MSRFQSTSRHVANINRSVQKFSSLKSMVKSLKSKQLHQDTQQRCKHYNSISDKERQHGILGKDTIDAETCEVDEVDGFEDENLKSAGVTKIFGITKDEEKLRKEAVGSVMRTTVADEKGRPSKRMDGEGTVVKIKEPYKLFKIEEGPALETKVTKEDAKKLFWQLNIIRRIENACDALYKLKMIRGFCHLYSGQEACATGMKAAINQKDYVITAYRAHGWTWLMGVSILSVIAEMTGCPEGCSRGKGGSMHTYGPSFFGGNGIVGACVPLGVGLALQCKMQKTGGVSIDCYGDGAANQGQVFEAFNLANLWKLPVVLVCENNQYGYSTSPERCASNIDFYKRGDYIPGIWVDGMDVIAVRNATEFAIDYVLKKGPIILEMYTYRYHGHSMADPGTSYRNRGEVTDIRGKHDPILRFKNLCLEYSLLSEAEVKEIDDKAKKEVDVVVQKVKGLKEVGLEELTYDLYINCLEPKIRMTTGYNGVHKLTSPQTMERLKKALTEKPKPGPPPPGGFTK